MVSHLTGSQPCTKQATHCIGRGKGRKTEFFYIVFNKVTQYELCFLDAILKNKYPYSGDHYCIFSKNGMQVILPPGFHGNLSHSFSSAGITPLLPEEYKKKKSRSWRTCGNTAALFKQGANPKRVHVVRFVPYKLCFFQRQMRQCCR